MSNVNYVPGFNEVKEFQIALFRFRQYGDFVDNTIGILRSVYSLAVGNIPPFGAPDEKIVMAYSTVLKQLTIIHNDAKIQLANLQDRAKEILVEFPGIPMQEFHNNTDRYSGQIEQVTILFAQLCELLGTEHLNPSDLIRNIGESCALIPRER